MRLALAIVAALLDRVRRRQPAALTDSEISQACHPLGSVGQILPTGRR